MHRTFVYCKPENGHIIGEIVRVERKGEGFSALYVYENSVVDGESLSDKPLPPKRAICIGDTSGIVCTECQAEKDWCISNRAAISQMIFLLNGLYQAEKINRKHSNEPI